MPSRVALRLVLMVVAALILIPAMSPVPLPAAQAPSKPQEQLGIDKLRAIYGQSLAKIEAEYLKKSQAWPRAYEQSLTTLLGKLQTAGDLEGLTATQNELDRFRTSHDIPDDCKVGSCRELAATQQDYASCQKKYDLERNRQIVKLAENYVSRLTAFQKQYTKDGKIEEALKYNQEIKRVNSSTEVTAAQFALADTPSGGTASEDSGDNSHVSTAADLSDTAPDNAPKTPASRTADKGKDEGAKKAQALRGPIKDPLISPNDPPDMPGLVFKKHQLRPTAVAKILKRVLVNAEVAKQSNMKDSNTDGKYIYYYTTVRSGEIAYHVRLRVRPTKASDSIDKCTLLVQYFYKDAARNAGKTRPKEGPVHRVALTELTGDGVWVDLPPVGVRKTEYDTDYYYWSSRDDRAVGSEFMGVAVSLFDADGNLVHQSSSTTSIDDFAATQLPGS